MSAEKAKATIEFQEISGEETEKDFSNIINEVIQPLSELSKEDIYVRAMYLVSDHVNSFGGKFPTEELERMQEMIINSPVLVGHRKDKLPIARNFQTELIEKDGQHWIKSYFYWLKESDLAETLKNNIDGGIYKECSVGFTFGFAECSICNKDIRECGHQPLKKYKLNKFSRNESVCHFNYREIEKVLETSLVYRGANPDTSFTKELSHSITEDAKLKQFLVRPSYQSVPVTIEQDEESRFVIKRQDNNDIFMQFELNADELSILNGMDKSVDALLVGYRGKERLPVEQLEKYLGDQKSSVSRVEIKIIPEDASKVELYHDISEIIKDKLSLNCSIINHRLVVKENIDKAIEMVETKDGTVVSEINSSTQVVDREFQLVESRLGNDYFIKFRSGNLFEIKNFSPKLFNDGRMFLIDQKSLNINNQLISPFKKNFIDSVSKILSGIINGREVWILKKDANIES